MVHITRVCRVHTNPNPMALQVCFCLLCIIPTICAQCLNGTYASGFADPPCYTCPVTPLSSAGGAITTACGCSAGYTGISGSCIPQPQCVSAGSLTCQTLTGSGTCLCASFNSSTGGDIGGSPRAYNMNINCQYLFASNALVTIRFTSSAMVVARIHKCTTAACDVNFELLPPTPGTHGPVWPESPVSTDQSYSSDQTYPFLRFWFTITPTQPFPPIMTNLWVKWAITGTPKCTCLPGQYSPDLNSCLDCPPNSFSPAGSTACVCNAGYDGPNGRNGPTGGPCVQSCEPGTYSSRLKFEARVTSTGCTPDAVGVYEDGGRLDFFIRPANANFVTMYIRRNGNVFVASRFTTGTSGRLRSSGATSIAVASIASVTSMEEWCPDTQIWSSAAVVFVARHVGPVCSPCMTGTYKSAHGNQACTNCPANSVSSVGSIALSSCYCTKGYMMESGGTCTACGAETGVPCVCPHTYSANILTDAFADNRKNVACIDFVDF